MRVEIILRTIPENATEPAIQSLVGSVSIPIFPPPGKSLRDYSIADLLGELTDRVEGEDTKLWNASDYKI